MPCIEMVLHDFVTEIYTLLAYKRWKKFDIIIKFYHGSLYSGKWYYGSAQTI